MGSARRSLLNEMLGMYVRTFPFEAEPGYKVTDAGYVTTLNPPSARLQTATGANKGVEYYEYIHDNCLGSDASGGDVFSLRTIVRATLTELATLNPQGEMLAGIEWGSLRCHPPFDTNWNVNGLNSIQLRYNVVRDKWEFMIYDGDGVVAPTVEDCSVQYRAPQAGTKTELMIDYQPGTAALCYLDGKLVHTYTGTRLVGFAENTSGCDAGGGVFVTSGSHASGRTTARFTMVQFITLGRMPRF